jgi:hypothetical protein
VSTSICGPQAILEINGQGIPVKNWKVNWDHVPRDVQMDVVRNQLRINDVTISMEALGIMEQNSSAYEDYVTRILERGLPSPIPFGMPCTTPIVRRGPAPPPGNEPLAIDPPGPIGIEAQAYEAGRREAKRFQWPSDPDWYLFMALIIAVCVGSVAHSVTSSEWWNRPVPPAPPKPPVEEVVIEWCNKWGYKTTETCKNVQFKGGRLYVRTSKDDWSECRELRKGGYIDPYDHSLDSWKPASERTRKFFYGEKEVPVAPSADAAYNVLATENHHLKLTPKKAEQE